MDDAMKRLDRQMTRWAAMNAGDGMALGQLGDLRRALIGALEEVEVALGPAIVRGAEGGMTYVELAAAGGYGSVTTIVKIMKDAGASPGSGRHPRNRSRVRR